MRQKGVARENDRPAGRWVRAILLGLPDILHAFGPTEAEVVTWGEVSLYTGAILVVLSIGIGRSQKRPAKVVLAIGSVVLALLQVPPVFLWLAFHGAGISDGAPPSTFVAHWGYSIPHLVLLIVSLMVLYNLVRGEPQIAP